MSVERGRWLLSCRAESRHLVLFQSIQRFLDFARNDKWSVPRMLRVSSETVKTLAVCWKKSAVSCIRVTNLITEISQSAGFILFEAAAVGDCRYKVVIALDWLTPLRR